MGAESIEQAVRIFQDNGIIARGNYMVPPDYGEDDFQALAEHASRFPVELAGYTILTPMPGTAYHESVRDRIVDRDLSRYNFFNCVLKSRLPADEFHARVGALWRIRKGDWTV